MRRHDRSNKPNGWKRRRPTLEYPVHQTPPTQPGPPAPENLFSRPWPTSHPETITNHVKEPHREYQAGSHVTGQTKAEGPSSLQLPSTHVGPAASNPKQDGGGSNHVPALSTTQDNIERLPHRNIPEGTANLRPHQRRPSIQRYTPNPSWRQRPTQGNTEVPGRHKITPGSEHRNPHSPKRPAQKTHAEAAPSTPNQVTKPDTVQQSSPPQKSTKMGKPYLLLFPGTIKILWIQLTTVISSRKPPGQI